MQQQQQQFLQEQPGDSSWPGEDADNSSWSAEEEAVVRVLQSWGRSLH